MFCGHAPKPAEVLLIADTEKPLVTAMGVPGLYGVFVAALAATGEDALGCDEIRKGLW